MPDVERLTQLVRVLDYVVDERLGFDLSRWYQVRRRWWGRCHIVSCPVGWAAQDSWFIEQGLRLAPGCGSSGFWDVVYVRYRNWKACEKFFDLSPDDADFLFSESAYNKPSAADVSQRVRAFVVGVTKSPYYQRVWLVSQ